MNETGKFSGRGRCVLRHAPTAEVKSAVAGFVSELKGFQSDIEDTTATTRREDDHAGT